jgi:hypothetical protein
MSILYKSFAIFLLSTLVTHAAGKEKTEPPKDPKQAEKENEAKESSASVDEANQQDVLPEWARGTNAATEICSD